MRVAAGDPHTDHRHTPRQGATSHVDVRDSNITYPKDPSPSPPPLVLRTLPPPLLSPQVCFILQAMACRSRSAEVINTASVWGKSH